MAAPTITQILNGIDTRLATISGLRHTPYIADQINPPHAVIHTPERVHYNSTFHKGMMELDVEVVIAVSKTVDRAAEIALDAYRDAGGTNSVALAIAGDATLGGVVDDCYVEDSIPLGQLQVGSESFYCGRFNLRVLAKGS